MMARRTGAGRTRSYKAGGRNDVKIGTCATTGSHTVVATGPRCACTSRPDRPERTVLQALIPNRDGPTADALRLPRARRPDEGWSPTVHIGRSLSASALLLTSVFHPESRSDPLRLFALVNFPILKGGNHRSYQLSSSLDHSRPNSPQGDAAGASSEATGHLSTWPLPFGDLASGELAKTLTDCDSGFKTEDDRSC